MNEIASSNPLLQEFSRVLIVLGHEGGGRDRWWLGGGGDQWNLITDIEHYVLVSSLHELVLYLHKLNRVLGSRCDTTFRRPPSSSSSPGDGRVRATPLWC